MVDGKTLDIIIVDPALVSLHGHHFQLNKTVLQALAPIAKSKTILAGQEFELCAKARIAGCRITPCLSGSFYGRGESQEGYALADALAAEIVGGIKDASPQGEFLLLVHTADALVYPALCSALLDPALAGATAVVSTPYDFRSMPNRRKYPRYEAAMYSLGALGTGYGAVRLGAETDLLADEWQKRLGIQFSTLELPVPQSIPRAKPANEASDGPIKIIALGNARVEKGFQHAPQIVKAARECAKPNLFKFQLQVTPQIAGYAPECLRAVKALEELEGPTCELIRENMSRRDYLELLREADSVLMPYDRELYYVRGSGIAVEAVASGKAVFSFPHTFPYSLAHRHTFALELPASLDQAELVALFDFAAEHWPQIRKIACAGSSGYRKANRSAAFADRIATILGEVSQRKTLAASNLETASDIKWAFV